MARLEGRHDTGDIALLLWGEGHDSSSTCLPLELACKALSAGAKEVERIDLQELVLRGLGYGEGMLGAIVVGERPSGVAAVIVPYSRRKASPWRCILPVVDPALRPALSWSCVEKSTTVAPVR